MVWCMGAQGELDPHEQEACQNFIYCRPVMRALLALPPFALRYIRALREPVHSGSPSRRRGNHSSCVCVHVCGRLKSFVLQLSWSSAVFPWQADHINWLSCLGVGERERSLVVSVYSICLFLTLAWVPVLISISLWSPPQPRPSGSCVTFSACLWVSDIQGI